MIQCVRFNLLSSVALKKLLKKINSFTIGELSKDFITKVLSNRDCRESKKLSSDLQNRHYAKDSYFVTSYCGYKGKNRRYEIRLFEDNRLHKIATGKRKSCWLNDSIHVSIFQNDIIYFMSNNSITCYSVEKKTN